MRVVIRGFADGQIKFEDAVKVPVSQIEELLPNLARKHGAALAGHELHMIEIEFPDEPDPNTRFFRFGTDPGGMVGPITVNL